MAKQSSSNETKSTTGVLPFDQEFPVNDNAKESSSDREEQSKEEDEEVIKSVSPEETDAFEEELEKENIISPKDKEKPITIKDTEELFDEAKAEDDEDDSSNKSRSSYYDDRKVIRRLIDNGTLLPLDIDKDIEDYSDEEIEELLIANIQDKTEKAQNSVLEQFISELDDNARKILEYAISGGKDFKSILKAIGELQEVSELEDNPEQIVRAYLKHKGMEEDEIEEQIEIYKKANALSSVADKYRDKVVELKQKEIEKKIEEQKKYEEQKRKYAEWYVQQIDNTLKKGKIVDIPIDKTKARILKKIVTEPTHTSLSGEKVPEFVKLLEKYSVEDPNPERIIEAAWLLYDRDSYIEALTQKIRSEVKAEEIRKLRSTIQRDRSSGSIEEPETTKLKKPTQTTRTNYKWTI